MPLPKHNAYTIEEFMHFPMAKELNSLTDKFTIWRRPAESIRKSLPS